MYRSIALVVLKTVHTIGFLVIGSCLLDVFVSGLRGRPGLRTLASATVVTGEVAVYFANDGVCPLTPMAERMGAGRGSVSDIFLPRFVARHLPVLSSFLLGAGVALNLRAVPDSIRRARASRWPQAEGRAGSEGH
jgi:hypothetical protein